MKNIDLKRICGDIIIIEKNLLNQYYKVIKINDKNELIEEINHLKELYMREQFYYLTLNLNYIDLNALCSYLVDDYDFNAFESISSADMECIIDRVSDILSDMVVHKTLEERMRVYIPSLEAISDDTITKYCKFSPVFGDYYEFLTKKMIRKYPSLDYLAVIFNSFLDKEKKNNELCKTAFTNYLITDDFFNELHDNVFPFVSAERLDSDQEKSRMDPYIFYAYVHSCMEGEAFDLTGVIEASDDDYVINLALEKLKVIIQYLDVNALRDLEEMFVYDKGILELIDKEILSRNDYVKGRAEYSEDTLLQENKLVTDLLFASQDLLNYYEEASYLEKIGQRESDVFKSIVGKINFKQNEERALALNLLDDINASEIMDTILFSKSIKTYYDVTGAGRMINEKDECLIKERLTSLLGYLDSRAFMEEIDNDNNVDYEFIPNDEVINLYLETGFDLGQPLALHDFYHQALQTMINMGLDRYIDTSENKEYYIDLKYNDLFVEPIIDKIAVDNDFNFKDVSQITPDYLEMVAMTENVSYELVRDSLKYYMNEYINAQAEKITDEDSLYNNYIKAKMMGPMGFLSDKNVKIYYKH